MDKVHISPYVQRNSENICWGFAAKTQELGYTDLNSVNSLYSPVKSYAKSNVASW